MNLTFAMNFSGSQEARSSTAQTFPAKEESSTIIFLSASANFCPKKPALFVRIVMKTYFSM
jgi:hypothetical protein